MKDNIFISIEEGINRFSSLKEDIKYISGNVLTDRLKLLEQHKFIHRNDNFREIPTRLEYSLTETGGKLSELLDGLCKFSENEVEFPP